MRQLYVWFKTERRLKGPLPDPGEMPEKEFLRAQAENNLDAVSGTLEDILRVLPREDRFKLGQALRPRSLPKEKK